jgi:hypothetical protein
VNTSTTSLTAGTCAAGYFVLVTFLTLYSMRYDTQLLLKAVRQVENDEFEEIEVESDLTRYEICYSVKITYTRRDQKGNIIQQRGYKTTKDGAGNEVRSDTMLDSLFQMEGW